MRPSTPRRLNPLACAVLLLAALTAGAQEGPPERERALFDEASHYLDQGLYKSAVSTLDCFLKDFPQSPSVPQALFKRATALTLQGNVPEAKTTYDLLVREHFGSPWARLVVRCFYEEDQLFRLAGEKRAAGRASDSLTEKVAAVELYELFLARFPRSARNKAEILYKMGKLDAARAQDKEGDWGKLAAIVAGDDATFRQRMDELVRLGGTGGEQLAAFLDLSAKYDFALSGDERARCLLYRARCLAALNRDAEERAQYEALRRDHPASPSAADAAFWLAEHAYKAGRRDEASAAYRTLAEAYPHSPRAAQARQWADWADQDAAAWAELEAWTLAVARRLSQGELGCAGRFLLTGPDRRHQLRARLAYDGHNRVLAEVTFAEMNLSLVNNAEGFWYRLTPQGGLCRSSPLPALPSFRGEIQFDPATRTSSFQFSLVPPPPHPGGSAIKIPPEVAKGLMDRLRSCSHLTRKDDGPGRRSYHLETPSWLGQDTDQLDLVFDADQNLRAATGKFHVAQGGTYTVTATDLLVGESPPEGLFKFSVPAGCQVREMEAVNGFELSSQIFQVFGTLTQYLQPRPTH